MQALNRRNLNIESLDGIEVNCNTRPMPVRVLQFGGGVFLRAFADWMIDLLNEKAGTDYGIAVLQTMSAERYVRLAAADGLYTVVLRGLDCGKPKETKRIVTSVRESLYYNENLERVHQIVKSPELRFVISNTTEAGIVYQPEDEANVSFPAKLTSLLWERFQHFDGSPESGLVFLPVELIENNGSQLRDIVLRHADDRRLGGDFTQWVLDDCIFCNTLVDRIVSGHPDDKIESIEQSLGYSDPNLVVGERYHLWVIEGPKHLQTELPLDKIGLNVVWTNDLRPYRTQKVRVLNGAHTSCVPVAWLCESVEEGSDDSADECLPSHIDTVGDMMRNRLTREFAERLIADEILPTLAMPDHEKKAYAAAVIERFCNPYLQHRLIDIALNSASKWRVRVLPTLLDYHRLHGRPPGLIALSFAALILFYHPEKTFEVTGRRHELRDDADTIEAFRRAWKADCPTEVAGRICSEESLWGMRLDTLSGMKDTVASFLQKIITNGMRQTIRDTLAARGM